MQNEMGFETRSIFADPAPSGDGTDSSSVFKDIDFDTIWLANPAAVDRLLDAVMPPVPVPRTPLLERAALIALYIIGAVFVAFAAGMMLVLLAAIAPLVAVACVVERWRKRRRVARRWLRR